MTVLSYTKMQHSVPVSQKTFNSGNNPYNEYVENALNPNTEFSIDPDPSNNLNINDAELSENTGFTLDSFSTKNKERE